jgi:uncharacterized phage infection (PIP) family protein YhgE
MPRYKIVLTVEASRIDVLQRKVQEVLGQDISATVVKLRAQSRADRLSDAESMVEDARSIVEELKDEIESWKDNLPENLQGGQKADELDDASSSLDDISSSLDAINFSDVSFPSMM